MGRLTLLKGTKEAPEKLSFCHCLYNENEYSLYDICIICIIFSLVHIWNWTSLSIYRGRSLCKKRDLQKPYKPLINYWGAFIHLFFLDESFFLYSWMGKMQFFCTLFILFTVRCGYCINKKICFLKWCRFSFKILE